MKVLIVEDDAKLAGSLAAALKADGMLADVSHDGEEGDYLGATGVYDAIVLDLGLPGKDGLSVLRGWRARQIKVPVLILTARGRWPEKRDGFNAGADDYLTKPFNAEEAVVRVRALIRRSSGFAAPALQCGPLTVDTAAGTASLDGEAIGLTSQEFRIVEFMIHRQGQIVSRLQLNDHVYGTDADPDSNVIDVLIGRIRKKIGPDLIATVRGRGYRMAKETE